jgi:hypothetical protein
VSKSRSFTNRNLQKGLPMHERPLFDMIVVASASSRTQQVFPEALLIYSTTSQRSNFDKGNNRTTTITLALETILQQGESLKGKIRIVPNVVL